MTKRQKGTRKRGKEKKVTVKLFLNKNLEPQPSDERGKVLYPLYMLITYNRRNTMIRSYYGMYYRELKEVEKGLLDFEEMIMKTTIAYELSQNPNKFELKGLHHKYEKYCVSIHLLFERYIKTQLHHILNRTPPHEFAMAMNFHNPKITFETLYAMSQRLYPDLSLPETLREEVSTYNDYKKLYNAVPLLFNFPFPTVIEWLDGSSEREYRHKLEVVYREDTEKIDRCIALIDKIVRDSLER